MAREALYTLIENEKVIFELNITNASRNFKTNLSRGPFLGGKGGGKGGGVFVVTNMRCFVALQTKSRACCFSQEERLFWTFPLKSLNGYNGYSSTQSKLCFCTRKSDFTIDVGMDYGRDKLTLSVQTNDISNHEQAQAIVAKLVELAQKANL